MINLFAPRDVLSKFLLSHSLHHFSEAVCTAGMYFNYVLFVCETLAVAVMSEPEWL
jgi:hypothetical protein